ncbi:MAG: zinc-ribbon domain-containing protein [Aigarchaeota archaeon]|nr:zinc-ribbon domain-containing protein [Aigarchaeota archaeon]MDW8092492.1 zinc-ribbon domain-containing protein [Nitrososphaerota archaeon]
MRCSSCSADLPDDARFCVSCGSPVIIGIQAVGLRCYVHPERFPVTKCTLCNRAICTSCRMVYAGKVVCKVCYMKDIIPSNAINNLKLYVFARSTIPR